MSDYIKREYVIKTVYKLREHFKCWDRNDDIAIKNALNAIPTADVVEADKAQKEIDYWHDKAQSYEQTILKLSLNKADDVRDYATAHKVVGGGEHDGATCWFECDNCGLAVDIGDVFCKHCGARFVP